MMKKNITQQINIYCETQTCEHYKYVWNVIV